MRLNSLQVFVLLTIYSCLLPFVMAANPAPKPDLKYTLPKEVVPLKYDLSVEPDFEKFTFHGDETITLQVVQPVKDIVMNGLELKVSSADIRSTALKVKDTPLTVKFEPETEKVHFISDAQLKPGVYQLHCKYEGILNHQLRGLYRSSYEDDAHKTHWIAATQMEPTDARRMFPGFDEPAFKAIFCIKAIIKKNLVAISNAPVAREDSLGSDKKVVVFEPTPKMSTYLLALILGEFKSTAATYSGKVPIKVWAVSGKESLGSFAQREAAKIFDFETKYFGVPYFGKKLDLIALPELGMFSAMENAGAITFHDTAILTDEKNSASSHRLGITSVMAHEMAHQWFGDLVTMKWWDDLWLNEAFATWMTPKVLAGLYPDSEASTNSVYSRYGSMSTDSLKATRAIHAAVVNPSQAVEMFDGITYQKGAAVLKMLESYVGESVFQRGITRYLKEHSLGNATADDFWNAIAQEAKGVPVPAIMRSFVFQPGYPQLNFVRSAGSKTATISQYRQLKSGVDKSNQALWMVPVVTRVLDSSSTKNTPTLLSKREQQFDFGSSDKPVFINAGANGYYASCYSRDGLKALQRSFNQLQHEEKIVLLNDCRTQLFSGDVSIEDYLDFVKMLDKEPDPLIQADLVYITATPDTFITEKERAAYQRWVCRTLLPLKNKLNGWNQGALEPQPTKELRLAVLSELGTTGQDKSTITEAFTYFDKFLHNNFEPSADFVPIIMRIVSYNGGAKEYNALLEFYKNSTNPNNKEMALSYLPLFHQADLAKRTLDFGMSDQVKVKQGIALIYGVTFNRFTRDIGWPFIKQNWDLILKRFPPESLRGLAAVGGTFDSAAKEEEVKRWYASHPVPYGNARVSRTLESMHQEVLYRQRYAGRIQKWLLAQPGVSQ